MAAQGELMTQLEGLVEFSGDDLAKLHREFNENSKDGIIDREVFDKIMDGIGQSIPIINKQLFDQFDLDKSGSIDFKEFCFGMCHVKKETLEEKLQIIFHVWDQSSSGTIEVEHLREVLKAIIARAAPDTEPENVEVMVLDFVRMTGIDHNEDVTFDQFKKAAKKCLHDVGGVHLFSHDEA